MLQLLNKKASVSSDEFAERVCPIKISDGAGVTLFNKGLVSCDVNQS